MPLPICAVTVTLAGPDGQPLAGASVSAWLSRPDVYQGLVVPLGVHARTDAAGRCTLALWPNALGVRASSYAIRIRHPMVRTITIPDVFVPDAGDITLQELLGHTPWTWDLPAGALRLGGDALTFSGGYLLIT